MRLKRAGAYIIDIVVALYSACFVTVPFAAVFSPFAIYIYIFSVYAFLSLRDVFGGQSLGRKLMGIKVVFKNGANADIASAVLRNMFLLLLPLELIMLLIFGKRIGDAVTGMTVTKAAPFEFKNGGIFVKRGAAFFIDYLIFTLVITVSFITIYLLKGGGNPYDKAVSALVMPILIVDIAGLLLKDIFGGQSIGKRIMGIKVITNAGEKPRLWQVLIRDLLSYMWPVAAIAIFVNGRRIADMLAGTEVVTCDSIKK